MALKGTVFFMRVLVIDDAYDILAPQLRQEGIEVIETGPSKTAMEGTSLAFRYVNAVDWILLDAQLGEDDDAGLKIVNMMEDVFKAKTISITGETLAKRRFRTLGIKHTPGKRVADIIRCIQGDCGCGREVEREKVLQESTLDVLAISSNGVFARSLARALSLFTSYSVIASSSFSEVIDILMNQRPKVVLYHDNFFGVIEHDYSHMTMRDASLPPLEQLYGFGVMLSSTGKCETKASLRGHKFINSSRKDLLDALLVLLGELIGGDDRKKVVCTRAMPVLESPHVDKLFEIARTMSPTSAKEEARKHVDEKTAQACRWLSILRREFGNEEFERFVLMHKK
jgi:hypothetical protein